jgi:hypothetical protein
MHAIMEVSMQASRILMTVYIDCGAREAIVRRKQGN